MKRILYTIAIILLSVSSLSAQDIITRKNGSKMECNVLEVNDRNIRYTHVDDPYGKTYIIRRSEVLMISDKDGNVDLISEMKYKDLRKIYDYRAWEPSSADRYNPSMMGVYSWLVPGLGQIMCGEVGRGAGLLAGAVGSVALTGAGAGMIAAYNKSYRENNLIHTGYYGVGVFMAIVGSAALLAVDVCAIVDACRVAKVKNLYDQSWRKKDYSMELHPYMDFLATTPRVHPTTGLTLAITF